MTFELSWKILSLKEYQGFHSAASNLSKPYAETAHLYPEKKFLPRPVWFKGSRNRGLRGDLAV